MIICKIVGQIRKISLYKMSFLPESYSHSKNKIKLGLDLSNYTIKSDLKAATGLDTSEFAEKSNIASLKSDIDKIDIDQLVNVPSCLNSLKRIG